MILKHLFAAAVGALAFSAPAHATTLVLDADWEGFEFAGPGSPWGTSFDFTLLSDAYLSVADVLDSGDRFEVFINGLSAGLTSAPTIGSKLGLDFKAAFNNPHGSSAEYFLHAGNYIVTGLATESPFGVGGAGIDLTTDSLRSAAVPLPAGGVLLVGALGGLGLLRRKRT